MNEEVYNKLKEEYKTSLELLKEKEQTDFVQGMIKGIELALKNIELYYELYKIPTTSK